MRHGPYTGSPDGPLSQSGIAAVTSLAARIKPWCTGIITIITSPLERATHTAEVLNNTLHGDIRREDCLSVHNTLPTSWLRNTCRKERGTLIIVTHLEHVAELIEQVRQNYPIPCPYQYLDRASALHFDLENRTCTLLERTPGL